MKRILGVASLGWQGPDVAKQYHTRAPGLSFDAARGLAGASGGDRRAAQLGTERAFGRQNRLSRSRFAAYA
jgi:hypothetical protein